MRSKSQVKQQTSDLIHNQVSQQDSKERTAPQLSYAELLCTASTLCSLDRIPLPWFSDEIRMSDDSRVQWLDLSITEPSPKQDVFTTSSDSVKNADPQNPSPANGESVSGHYLDHIEAVQERDQRASNKRKRRSSKSKPKVKQTQKVQKQDQSPTKEVKDKRPSSSADSKQKTKASKQNETLLVDSDTRSKPNRKSKPKANHESKPKANHESKPKPNHESKPKANHEPKPKSDAKLNTKQSKAKTSSTIEQGQAKTGSSQTNSKTSSKRKSRSRKAKNKPKT